MVTVKAFRKVLCKYIINQKDFWDSPIINTAVHTDRVILLDEFAAFIF